MATLFDEYVAEELAEERAKNLTRGIKNMVETYYKFNQDYSVTREAVIEKYPDVEEKLIDSIIDEVYQLVK